MRELEVRRLGLVPYDEALAMQRQLVEERRAGRVPDLLLFLQHPAVITLGVKGDGGRANIVATDERLAELGIAVHETGRGGDVTYHGPDRRLSDSRLEARSLRRASLCARPRGRDDSRVRRLRRHGWTDHRPDRHVGGCGEDRRDWRQAVTLDYEPWLRVQRQHRSRSLQADCPVRHQRRRVSPRSSA